MSRNYANISTAIWRRDEFRALSVGAQHMYLLLCSQPDISAAGVLPLSVKRWSNQTAGATSATVVAALSELSEHRYVVYDTETEELLVRSFVKWDNGYTNPKRRPVIQRAAQDVESKAIRGALASEFKRLGLPDWLPDSLSDPLSDARSEAHEQAVAEGIVVDLFPQGNSLSDRQSPSDGVVVTVVTTDSPTHNPQTSAPPALPALPGGGATVNQRSKAITDTYNDLVGGLCNWNGVNQIVGKAIKAGRWADEEIRDALLRMAADNRSVTADSLRIELTGPPAARAAPTSKPSTTDQRVAIGMALAAKFDNLGPHALPGGAT